MLFWSNSTYSILGGEVLRRYVLSPRYRFLNLCLHCFVLALLCACIALSRRSPGDKLIIDLTLMPQDDPDEGPP